MAERMSFAFDGSAASVLRKARSRIARHGGRLTGDETVGNFEVMGVKGKYSIRRGKLTITIVQKRWYQTMGMIRSVVRGQVEEICGGPA